MSGSVKPELDEQDPDVKAYLEKYGKQQQTEEADPVDAYLKRFGKPGNITLPITEPTVTVGQPKGVVGPHGESLITSESMSDVASGKHGLAPAIGAAVRLGRGRPGYENIGNVAEGDKTDLPVVTADKLEAPAARGALSKSIRKKTAPGVFETAQNIAVSEALSPIDPEAADRSVEFALDRFTEGGGDASKHAKLFGAAAAAGATGLSLPLVATPSGAIADAPLLTEAAREAAKSTRPIWGAVTKRALTGAAKRTAASGAKAGALLAGEGAVGSIAEDQGPYEMLKRAAENFGFGFAGGAVIHGMGEANVAAKAGQAAGRARAAQTASEHPEWFGETIPADVESRHSRLLENPNRAKGSAQIVGGEPLSTEPDYTVDEPSPVETKGVFGGAPEQAGKAFAARVNTPVNTVNPVNTDVNTSASIDELAQKLEQLKAKPPKPLAGHELDWDKTAKPKLGDRVTGEDKKKKPVSGVVVEGADGLKVKTDDGRSMKLTGNYATSWKVEGDPRVQYNADLEQAEKAHEAAVKAEDLRKYNEHMDSRPKLDLTQMRRGDVIGDVSASDEPSHFLVYQFHDSGGTIMGYDPLSWRDDPGFIGDARGLVKTGQNVEDNPELLDEMRKAAASKPRSEEDSDDRGNMPQDYWSAIDGKRRTRAENDGYKIKDIAKYRQLTEQIARESEMLTGTRKGIEDVYDYPEDVRNAAIDNIIKLRNERQALLEPKEERKPEALPEFGGVKAPANPYEPHPDQVLESMEHRFGKEEHLPPLDDKVVDYELYWEFRHYAKSLTAEFSKPREEQVPNKALLKALGEKLGTGGRRWLGRYDFEHSGASNPRITIGKGNHYATKKTVPGEVVVLQGAELAERVRKLFSPPREETTAEKVEKLHDEVVAKAREEIAEDNAASGKRIREDVKKRLGTREKNRAAAKAAHDEASKYDYSSTQLDLTPKEAAGVKRLAAQIPDADLAEHGREQHPHVTVKYGLHGQPIKQLVELLADQPPITLTFGKTKFFPDSGDGDVVYVEVDSPELHALNKKIADALPHTDTHPGYKPHVTVAYVKPGLGQKYAGNDAIAGEELTIDTLTFSDKGGQTDEIELTGGEEKESREMHDLRYRVKELREIMEQGWVRKTSIEMKGLKAYEHGHVEDVKRHTATSFPRFILNPAGVKVIEERWKSIERTLEKKEKGNALAERTTQGDNAGDERRPEARKVRETLPAIAQGSEAGEVPSAREPGQSGVSGTGEAGGGGEHLRIEPPRTPDTESGAGGRPGTSAAPADDRVPSEGAGARGYPGAERRGSPRDSVNAAENIALNEGDVVVKGLKAKADRNVAAIRLLQEIEAAGRMPTVDEQRTLAGYVGWGGLSAAFDEAHKDFARFGGSELQKLLTPAEYEAARASTPNAHYTSPTVIRTIYNTLRVLHVPLNPNLRVLEPAMGVGHFIGFAPAQLRTARWTGVELDVITGRIAKLLYPKADIHVKGFESYVAPDGTYDLVISNVPFGKIKLHEPKYNKLDLTIHNHFIVKSLDLTRLGGIVAVVSSGYTLDAKSSSARAEIAKRGEFIGAIRLPDNAFMENANTKVVTDILFFRKKGAGIPAIAGDRAWLKSDLMHLEGGDWSVNEYFQANPRMVVGKMTVDQGNRGMPRLSVTYGEDLAEGIARAAQNLPQDVYISADRLAKLNGTEKPVEPLTEKRADAPDDWLDGQFGLQSGELVQKVDGKIVREPVAAGDVAKVKQLVQMRDAYLEVLRTQRQDESEPVVVKAREKLNAIYDRFVKAFGPIGKEERTTTKRTLKSGAQQVTIRRPNLRAFSDDPTHVLLSALEHFDYETGKAEKRDALLRRVIDPHRVLEKAANPAEALPFVLAERARVDLAEIARLAGVDQKTARQGLTGLVYENPETGELELADRYLSGDVKAKLRTAESLARKEPRFKENVEALKKVQPADLPPSRIWASVGANWIPATDYRQFLQELLQAGNAHSVEHSATLALWKVVAPRWLHETAESRNKWGTQRASALQLFQDALNQRATIVYDPHPEDPQKRVVNPTETLAAQEKQEALKAQFQKWLWEDQPRSERLARVFNDRYNTIAESHPDGSHLTFPGTATHVRGKEFKMRPHQKNAVWRILQNGNTLLAHVVGAGKTAVMVMAGMEAKRTGLANKPLYIVPNHMLYQFAGEFQELYPNAQLLVATKDDLRGEERRAFVSRASGHNWDAIIMTHRSAESVPMSPEFQSEFIRGQLAKLEAEMRQARAGRENRNIVKELETAKKNLTSKLQGLLEQKKDAATVNFEDLGVDLMFVDEAHMGKNLQIVSKIRGQGRPGSQRAFDLLMKSLHLDNVNPGRGLVFATGTPISNSISEVHTMMRYLQPRLLKELGLEHFDDWIAAFAESTIAMELNPTGPGYRMKSRFRKFKNVGRLAALFRQVWDVQSAAMLKLPHPPLIGGKAEVISTPATPWHEQLLRSFDKRAEAIRRKLVDPADDNFLKITTEGRHAGLDARLVDATARDRNDGKLERAAEKIDALYKETTRLKGVQLVFSDLSAPGSDPSKTLGGVAGFNVYDALKAKLVARGIPGEQIAFIHEGASDDAKDRLFKAVREGRIRVLLGSTEKMGAGMNVQNRLVAEHHLDAPWRPSDIEQREGRILRQGNELYDAGKIDGVRIFRYIQEKSFDAYLWQTLQTKAGFIDQVMRAGPDTDEIEDVSERELSFSEIKAIASGDPRVMEKAVLDARIAKLEALERQSVDERYAARQALAKLPARIKMIEEKVAALKADMARRVVTAGDQFKVMLDGKEYTKRPEAGVALKEAVQRFAESIKDLSAGERYDKSAALGEFAGFPLYIRGTATHNSFDLILEGEIQHDANVAPDDSPVSLIARLERMLDRSLDAEFIEQAEIAAERERKSRSTLEAAAGGTSEHGDELKELKAKQETLDRELKQAAADREKESDNMTVAGGELNPPVEEERSKLGSMSRPTSPPAGRRRLGRKPGTQPIAVYPEPSGLSQPRAFRPRELVRSILMLLNPEALGADARGLAGTLRHRNAESFRELKIAQEQLREFKQRIDDLPRATQVDLWDKAERGQPTGNKEFDLIADTLHKVTEKYTNELVALDRLKAASTIDNYIGRFWSKPTSKKGFDFLRRIMGKRPFEGPKSFEKRRTYDLFKDGLDAGLTPATYNYVESQLAKIAEMQRVIAAERTLRDEKAAGRAKPIMMGGEIPLDLRGEPWEKIDRTGNDPAFNVYLPPEVPHWESVDTVVFGKLQQLLKDLKVTHSRTAAGSPGRTIGGTSVHTRFGGAEGTIMHELGHVLDHRYKLWRQIDNAIEKEQDPKVRLEMREELRQLANLREETLAGVPTSASLDAARRQYLHSRGEKMAAMVEAYIAARSRFKQVAPRIYDVFDKIVAGDKTLKRLRDIQPSIAKEEHVTTTRIFGIITGGHWYAPKEAIGVWNAHLSKGWRGHPVYDAMMAPATASAQILLGFSGFHLTTIAREGINSSLALALDDAVNKGGKRGRALKHLKRAPAAIAADAAFGKKIMEEFRKPGTHPELARVLDAMIKGGYRGTAESDFWTGERVENLKRAFHDAVHAQAKGRRLWGASRIPIDALWAGIELQMKPLMGYYVPWMKTAATYRAVAQALDKLPQNATLDEVHKVMGDIVKEMDYRYGQVVYDNHFINRSVKNLAQLVFLAPGWTFGTLTLAGRGIGQIAKIPYKAWKAKGVPDELIGKSAAYWIGGVLFFGLVNGILTYLHTGEMPHGKDYFGYRDGTLDDAGNPNRHIIPGYEMRDIYSWSQSRVKTFLNKLSPAIAFIARVAQNHTYFGDFIYDPDATPATKVKQVAKEAARELGTPLSVQNFKEGKKRGEKGAGEMVRNALGITPAKREFVRTPAQNKMAEFLSRSPHTTRTPDEVEQGDLHREVIDATRKGVALPDAAANVPPRKLRKWIKDARRPSLVAQFDQLSVEQAKVVWSLANEHEKEIWTKSYRRKLRSPAAQDAKYQRGDDQALWEEFPSTWNSDSTNKVLKSVFVDSVASITGKPNGGFQNMQVPNKSILGILLNSAMEKAGWDGRWVPNLWNGTDRIELNPSRYSTRRMVENTLAHELEHHAAGVFDNEPGFREAIGKRKPQATQYAAENFGEHMAEAFMKALDIVRTGDKDLRAGKPTDAKFLIAYEEQQVPGVTFMLTKIIKSPLYKDSPIAKYLTSPRLRPVVVTK